MIYKFQPVFDGTILGIPKAQPRARAFARNGKARMYDPGTAEAWKGDIAAQTTEIHGKGIEDDLEVSLYFFFSRPKSHYRSNGHELKPGAPFHYFAKKPDADNLAKAVLDALTALNVWVDDCQVVILRITKVWSFDNRSGCKMTIKPISDHAN